MSRLSQYFTGVAAKRLSAVETDGTVSNQHEFNGIRQMANLFGTERVRLDCSYVYFCDDEDKTITSEGFLSWYDARENHPTRTEYRLYFQENAVMELASSGDLLVIGKRSNNKTIALIVKKGTTIESQILWLFGIENNENSFTVKTIEGEYNKEIGYAERTILETIGIELTEETETWLDRLLERFGSVFPSTKVFSEFARQTIPGASALEAPDATLLAWVNQEEMLFRTLERHIVQQRIDAGFSNVDDFVHFSLSVQNRRKARVGFALENHLTAVFNEFRVAHSRGKMTENRATPDFIFPGINQYHDASFPVERLTMLGSKSTCKDRWRQVLVEADKIEHKHLFTLEPGISLNQTNEMISKRLQLVLPQGLHYTYQESQQAWLMNLSEFLALVQARQ